MITPLQFNGDIYMLDFLSHLFLVSSLQNIINT